MGKDIFKVIGLQYGIFFLYQTGMYFLVIKMHYAAFVPLEMFLVCTHWLILLILMIVFFATRKTGKAIGYLLSFITLLVIGFGSCASIFFGFDEPVIEEQPTPELKAEWHRQDSVQLIYLHNDSVNEGLLPGDTLR
jgi:hypothetical protein